MAAMKDFSFWTAVIGSFSGSRYLVDSAFPYELNVVVDRIGAKEISGARARVVMHKAHPSKDDNPIRARKAIFRECVDYCKTRFMVWLDSDLVVHGSLDFIQTVQDLDFLIAGIPNGLIETENGELRIRLHFGFLIVDTTHPQLATLRKRWRPYMALTKWRTKIGKRNFIEGAFTRAHILDVVPHLLIPMKYLSFPTHKTDVTKETLVHYTHPRRGFYLPFEKGQGELPKRPDRWEIIKDLFIKLGRSECLTRWVHVWSDNG